MSVVSHNFAVLGGHLSGAFTSHLTVIETIVDVQIRAYEASAHGQGSAHGAPLHVNSLTGAQTSAPHKQKLADEQISWLTCSATSWW